MKPLLYILIAFAVVVHSENCDNHLQYNITAHDVPSPVGGSGTKRCCVQKLCAEGTYGKVCDDQNPFSTTCEPCEEGTYLKFATWSDQGITCHEKTLCDPALGYTVHEEGGATEDRTCMCNRSEGYYLLIDVGVFGNQQRCKRVWCRAGTEVNDQGECTYCRYGTFKEKDGYPSCAIRTDCLELGLVLVRHGNRTTDNICAASTTTGLGTTLVSGHVTDNTPIVGANSNKGSKDDRGMIVGVVIGSLAAVSFVLILLCYVYRRYHGPRLLSQSMDEKKALDSSNHSFSSMEYDNRKNKQLSVNINGLKNPQPLGTPDSGMGSDCPAFTPSANRMSDRSLGSYKHVFFGDDIQEDAEPIEGDIPSRDTYIPSYASPKALRSHATAALPHANGHLPHANGTIPNANGVVRHAGGHARPVNTMAVQDHDGMVKIRAIDPVKMTPEEEKRKKGIESGSYHHAPVHSMNVGTAPSPVQSQPTSPMRSLSSDSSGKSPPVQYVYNITGDNIFITQGDKNNTTVNSSTPATAALDDPVTDDLDIGLDSQGTIMGDSCSSLGPPYDTQTSLESGCDPGFNPGVELPITSVLV